MDSLRADENKYLIMGSSCGCEISEVSNEFFNLEFEKNSEKTLFGRASNEEHWVQENQSLHTTQISTRPKRGKSVSSQRSRNLESFHISLNRSVQSYTKTEDEPDQIIYEGELLKYRPGMSAEYISRWCRLTFDGFAYYKSRWAATCSNKTPLAFIPILQIHEVSQVSRSGKRLQNLFEFEIFLVQEEELVKLSRSTEGFTLRKNDSHDKVPGSWWSVRQVEWYTAERRLLFASPKKNEVKTWVEKLKKATSDVLLI
jgi:hypothetical protein